MDTLFILGAKYLFIIPVLWLGFLFYQSSPKDRKSIFIFSLLSFSLALIVSKLLGQIYFNPRPFVVGNFKPLIDHAPDNGFPSDHALLVGALASVVTIYYKKYQIWFWLIAILVAISRVYVGVHHSIDVLASLVITGISALIIKKVLDSKKDATIIK